MIMNKTRYSTHLAILIIILITPFSIYSQSGLKPYINGGYVTNIKKYEGSTKADQGGSIRIGILNKGLFGNGRFGFYGGYLWFKEFNLPSAEYDDRGTVIMAGTDFLIYKKGSSNFYLKLGLARERFITTLRTDGTVAIDHSFKPDIGIFYNINKFNAFIGSQPSQPGQINIGVGLTFDSSLSLKESGY